MKTILSLTLILFSAMCCAQSAGTIMVTKDQLDSTVINGQKVYILKNVLTDPQLQVLNKASADASNAVATNATQETRIKNVETGLASIPAAKQPEKLDISSFIVTQSQNGGRFQLTKTCTVSFSGLQPGFHCDIYREGGEVTFTGTFKSKLKYKRIQTQWAKATIDVMIDGTIYITGDLKQ